MIEKILKIRALITSVDIDVSETFDETVIPFEQMKNFALNEDLKIDNILIQRVSDFNNTIVFLCRNLGDDAFIGSHSHPDFYEILCPIDNGSYDYADMNDPIYIPASTQYIIPPNQKHNIFIPTGATLLVISIYKAQYERKEV